MSSNLLKTRVFNNNCSSILDPHHTIHQTKHRCPVKKSNRITHTRTHAPSLCLRCNNYTSGREGIPWNLGTKAWGEMRGTWVRGLLACCWGHLLSYGVDQSTSCKLVAAKITKSPGSRVQGSPMHAPIPTCLHAFFECQVIKGRSSIKIPL